MQHVIGLRPVGLRLALALLTGACSTYDPDLLPRRQKPSAEQDGGGAGSGGTGSPDAGGRDGGDGGGVGPDGGGAGSGGSGAFDAGTVTECIPNPDPNNEVCTQICPEVCNNKDDDCDRRVDEEPAGADCVVANGSGACFEHHCIVASCEPGYQDCDGEVDTGCEVPPDDLEHCGDCTTSCTSLYLNGAAACVSGACMRTGCALGFQDCDGNALDCEQDITLLDHCGDCTLTCDFSPNATPSCDTGVCGPGECLGNFGDCNLAAGDGCEQELNSNDHCGKCDTACAFPGTDTECSTGTCLAVTCNDPEYDECDGDFTNGCEWLGADAHCGGCNQRCDATLEDDPTKNVGSAQCASMQCQVTCEPGFADCENGASDGCETSLGDPQHCNGCAACDLPHAVAACQSGECVVQTCEPGFHDCGGGDPDGCETPDSEQDCGGCSAPCPNSQYCVGGTCSAADCSVAPFSDDCGGGACGNCDGNDADCETDLGASLTHCKSCGNACTFTDPPNARASASCTPQGCKPVCDPGYGDCNGVFADGCERQLNTLGSCDGCGTVCSIPNAQAQCTRFVSGHYVCEVAGCQTDYADCDGDNVTCESPLSTPEHCGSCANVCDLPNATEACTGGTGNWQCTIAACDSPDLQNCDTQHGNGCETDVTSAGAHCGSCNNNCAAHANVTGGSCNAGACSYTCSANFKDCTAASPGCETDLRTLSNCGDCGTACGRANATASCGTGSCTIASCNANYDDCDGVDGNGCEPLNTLGNCGACGAPCTIVNGTGDCSSRTCVIASCNAGWDHCSYDSNPLDCERNTDLGAGGQGPCFPDTGCTRVVDSGHEYFFCSGTLSWLAARTNCEKLLLGSLVHVDDATENAFVQTNTGGDAWIGASDATTEGTWRWSDDASALAYSSWNTGEPNNSGDEDCAEMRKSDGKWNDLACTAARRYVCEVQGDQCPADASKTKPGQCGCGVPDTDGDGDATADCNDGCPSNAPKTAPGQCGCATADTDGDGDGTADCNDGCPADPGKTGAGQCGCGVADIDSDGDGTLNCQDGCPNDPTKIVGPCGFGYTPANWNPAGVTFTGDVVVSCNATVTSVANTTAITICGTSITPVLQNQTGGPQLYVLPMASLTVQAGFTLKLNGDLPVVLAVMGSATIAGSIDAGSVSNATKGAGANITCSPGTGGNGATGAGDGGGGGGGYGLGGNAGGNGGGTWGDGGGNGGGGGGAGGNAQVSPLRGGCAGGKNGGGGGQGGHGGGAVQLSAGATLTLTSSAVVSASGGGAPSSGGIAAAGGAGGGSGGSVLLEGLQLSIDPGAFITANGGGGSNGDGNQAGSDGLKTNTAQAPGGSGGGAGGKGGALAGGATAGGAGAFSVAWIDRHGGGGGGGGVGRIRVHSPAASCSVPTARISPAASVACP